jgi:hypothetical protein
MAVFIKKVFKKSVADKKLEEAKLKPKNQKKLSDFMKDYVKNFTSDIDVLWDSVD